MLFLAYQRRAKKESSEHGVRLAQTHSTRVHPAENPSACKKVLWEMVSDLVAAAARATTLAPAWSASVAKRCATSELSRASETQAANVEGQESRSHGRPLSVYAAYMWNQWRACEHTPDRAAWTNVPVVRIEVEPDTCILRAAWDV